MKRLTIALAVLSLVAASAWTAIHRARMTHPYSGQEITIPGKDGDGILLSDGARMNVLPMAEDLARSGPGPSWGMVV